MVRLFQENQMEDGRHSSKGNQLKWRNGECWYKADYTGYEGLTEYAVSHLLQYTNLHPDEYVIYDTEQIQYGEQKYRGCVSRNFLPDGWQLITLERLFQLSYGESLNRSIYHITGTEERIRFLTEQTERLTGLSGFGIYISKMLAIDAFFLNEDRHTHNMAVLMDEKNGYHLCPFFDHGAALLSDTTMDYPLESELYGLIDKVQSKTFCPDFVSQTDQADQMYGMQIRFHFGEEQVREIMAEEKYYPEEIKERVINVLLEQKRKYRYLFCE